MSTPSVDDSLVGSELVKSAENLPEDLETGMDELEEGGYPRLRIGHKERRFIESVSDTEYESISGVVILGFNYSRVMWKPTKPGQGFSSDELPQCRSNDNRVGQPNTDSEKPAFFPWKDSVFDAMKAQANPMFNRVLLDCTRCNFAIWGSDGTRPACGLIMNVYVMYQPPGAEQPVAAFMSIKGAGLKPMKKFFKSCKANSSAPYQFSVTLSLDSHVSGEVEYCTPKVRVDGVIPKEYWAGLSEQYAQMRNHTQAIIIEPDDKEIQVVGNVPPKAQDPDFIMSIESLKDGIDPNSLSGGGRRSAPPPRRVPEISAGPSSSPLGGLMGGSHQTIQGSVISNVGTTQQTPPPPSQQQTPPQSAPAPAPAAQAPAQNVSQPQQPSVNSVTTGQPSGTPSATAAAPTPPPQSAPASATASSGIGIPMMGMPQMPQAVAVAEPMPGDGVAVETPPWAADVPGGPDGFAAPGTDSYDEEPEGDDVSGEAFPWT